jgi:hypothetical protein
MQRSSILVLIALVTALPAPAHDYFPLEVGNTWQYAGVRVDSLGTTIPGSNYTAYSIVADTASFAGLAYYAVHDSSDSSGAWQLERTRYLRDAGDTLKLLTRIPIFADTTLVEFNLAILPLPVASQWTIYALDTTIQYMSLQFEASFVITGDVLGFGPKLVHGVLYPDCYTLAQNLHLELHISIPPMTYVFNGEGELWLAQGVGAVHSMNLPIAWPTGTALLGSLEELVEYSLPVAAPPAPALPPAFTLYPAFPNPFNGDLRLTFSLPQAGPVSLILTDLGGRTVETIFWSQLPAGLRQTTLRSLGLSSGVYWVSLSSAGSRATQKVVLVK